MRPLCKLYLWACRRFRRDGLSLSAYAWKKAQETGLDIGLMLVFSILLLDVPQEITLSGKLWRLSNGADSWRQRIAIATRTQLLDWFDPAGEHKG